MAPKNLRCRRISRSFQRNALDKYWLELRRGNQSGLAPLFQASYRQLIAYGYEIYPSKEFIKDAIQDLFLKLWEKRAGLGEAVSVMRYLCASLRRIIFRKLEKVEHRMQRNRRYRDNMENSVFNVEELMIHIEAVREEKNQFVAAMESLRGQQKEVIHLKLYAGLSGPEIA